MLENERIIVQDRGGIDAGIAALMQNARQMLRLRLSMTSSVNQR